METVEEMATRLLKEIDSAWTKNRRSKPARRKQVAAARRKRGALGWLGLGARLVLVAGAIGFWLWSRRQRLLSEEMEQDYLHGPSGPYDYTRRAGSQTAASTPAATAPSKPGDATTPAATAPSKPAPTTTQAATAPSQPASTTTQAAAVAAKEPEPCGEMQNEAASAGAQSSGRSAVQTATRAEPLPGAAGRMAAGESAPGGIAAAFPAKPAQPAQPPAEAATTPDPTVLAPADAVSPEVAPLVSAADESRDISAAPVPDDLKRIEGIGPRIAAVLGEQGITTFAQLAETPLDRLQAILRSHPNLRLADPATWPEQAALAARGDWTALTALQGSLKAGRRTNP